jgi:hypothetical protein
VTQLANNVLTRRAGRPREFLSPLRMASLSRLDCNAAAVGLAHLYIGYAVLIRRLAAFAVT